MRIDIANKKNFSYIISNMIPDITLPEINGISINSNNIQPGDIFLPLKGRKFDGHKFISDAKEKGASLAFVEDDVDVDLPNYNVKSTKKFLYDVISNYRRMLNYPFIGITGSNGKTTTKELLYHVLSSKMTVEYTRGNFNSTTGAPLSLLGFKKNADIAIIEIGANKPGEIKFITNIIKPEMGIITNIGEAHLSNFGSLKNIAKSKSALFSSLPSDGKAFINIDDPYISSMKTCCQRIEYSLKKSSNYHGIWDEIEKILKINGKLIKLNSKPKTMCVNSLAVYAIASELGCSNNSIANQIQSFEIPRGRGNIIKIDEYTIIDDCYNANFDSVKLGINNFLSSNHTGRKILILGDMLELGIKEKQYHKELGSFLNDKKQLDAIYCYGELSKHIINEMKRSKIFNIFFSNKNLLIENLKNYLIKGDTIYIKGSRKMQMEEIILGLKS